MKIIEKILEMQSIILNLKKKSKKIGFVPTMGALHEGHLSLIREARKENDIVVVSIFVNPIQFGPNEDLNKYPRTFESDKKNLEREKVDFLFFPTPMEMYPEGFETYVNLKKLPYHLCGLSRPGHFEGVATVVAKLFNIVMPDNAYFGQKDYQQAKIIERMVLDLNFKINIKIMPIVREKDGLAMSSRNSYLTTEERKKALCLYQALQKAKEMIEKGEIKIDVIKKEMEKTIKEIAPDANIDYIAIVHPDTLSELSVVEKRVVVALAVFIGSTRLIDNFIIERS
ncbi:MAG: pantoate--beta-alanine ligase [Brevinematales bacterium]|nr:pantoate--beta-alanine ligase [Brevinematales bacterium]